jgi:lambda family phage portal protein
MNVSYNKLGNDLEGVNYSSLREGRIDESDMWRGRQQWFTEWVCQPIFSRWLDMAILSGRLPIPARKADLYRFPTWKARGWPWVDPEKEATANRTAIALALRSRTRILAEQGEDFEDVVEELAAEAAIMRAAGLDPTVTLPGGAMGEPGSSSDTSAPADSGKPAASKQSTTKKGA